MSDMGERLDLRDLPPVEPVEPPSRLSMTLLRHYQACNRSAYLYMRRHGGMPAHNLDFGTALHLFQEKALGDLIRAGESTLYAAEEGESVGTAQQQVASLTAAMVDEVLREHPELTVPVCPVTDAEGNVLRSTQDDLREAAYHWAVGYAGQMLDPSRVIGLERKFVLDLECGWTVSGKLDVLAEDGPEGFLVDDAKSGFNLPTEQAFENRFQVKTYALLAVFGEPVEKVNGGEVRRGCIGRGVQTVRGREVYPRMRLRDDGTVQHRETSFSRQELADFRWDLERLGYELSTQLGSWKFPAVPGSHCTQCPSPQECPLPAELRNEAGTVQTPGEALERLAWADRTAREVSAAKREVRRFVDEHGVTLRLGDQVWEIAPQSTVKLDKHGLAAAARETATYGGELDVSAFEKEQVSMRFRPRKLSAAELAGLEATTEEGTDGERERDERFGAEAPF